MQADQFGEDDRPEVDEFSRRYPAHQDLQAREDLRVHARREPAAAEEVDEPLRDGRKVDEEMVALGGEEDEGEAADVQGARERLGLAVCEDVG